jgi:hypothetical protein
MTDEAIKKRDRLAKSFEQDLDAEHWIEALEQINWTYKEGFDVGYEFALEQERARSQILVEALRKIESVKAQEDEWTEEMEEMWWIAREALAKYSDTEKQPKDIK